MSIADAVARHASQRPDALAAADARERLGWATLAERVDALAQRLRAGGVGLGDRVALCAPDGVAALVAALAVLRAGAVHCPIDHQLAPPEIAAALDALGAPWLLAPDGGALALTSTGRARAEDPLGGGSAFVRHSSGTTGAAKGVLLSHATLAERIAAANRGLRLGADDRVLWLLPMAYHFAVSIALYVAQGAAVVFGAAVRAAASAALAREHATTFAYASPWHVRRLAELPPGQDLPPTLRDVVATTTALDAGAAALFRARHGIGVRQGLGIIEVGLPLLSAGAPQEAPGDFGPQLPDYRVEIVGADGAPLPPGEPGELAIGGPGLLDAYLAPWRPRAQILHRGCFRTGDSAVLGADGGVRLLGRIKDVVNVGGMKVFPLEVETVLCAHPAVAAARVVGEADPRTGERVRAEVQLATGADPATAVPSLDAWCAERLAPLKRPASIVVVERLATTGSGKVLRAR